MTRLEHITFPEYDDSDEESDTLYTKELIKETSKSKKNINHKLKVKLISAHVDIVDHINMIDTFDRPADISAEGIYAHVRTYEEGLEDEPGKRIPKAGFYTEVGIGRVRAEASVFEFEAKGPNTSFGAEISAVEVGLMTRGEIASTSVKAGPVSVKVGLGVDMGASFGVNGVEAKFLGTGFTLGEKNSVSLVGSEVSCSIM